MKFMTIQLTSCGEGMPLVFFHGWGFDHQIWLPVMTLLQSRYQIILVDLPGFGLTPMMGWLSFKAQLLAQLPDKFAVIGWSMGGLYAMRLAIEEPQQVTHLLTICSSPRFIGDSVWPGVHYQVFIRFYDKLSANLNATLEEFTRLQTDKSCQFIPGNPPSSAGLRFGLDILEHWDFRKSLSALKSPACFMFGRLDPITPVKTMQHMQDVYPDFHYVLFNKAAHMPFLSHSDSFIKELLEFIN